jgi:PleD family two-component response regulator
VTDKKPLLLVIDDDMIDRQRIRRLVSGDFRVLEASSGNLARQSLQSATPDCILLDYRLPDVNGWALLDELVSRSLPVVLLTGQDEVSIAVDAIRRGARDYLCKFGLRKEQLRYTLGVAIKAAVAEVATPENLKEPGVWLSADNARELEENLSNTVEKLTQLLARVSFDSEIYRDVEALRDSVAHDCQKLSRRG